MSTANAEMEVEEEGEGSRFVYMIYYLNTNLGLIFSGKLFPENSTWDMYIIYIYESNSINKSPSSDAKNVVGVITINTQYVPSCLFFVKSVQVLVRFVIFLTI